MTEHFPAPPPPDPFVLTERATRAASVKASLTPRLRFAEHSVLLKRGLADDMLRKMMDLKERGGGEGGQVLRPARPLRRKEDR